VKVFPGVGHQVMPAMMCRPPERTFLIRGRSGERDQKLKNSTGAIGAMGQQAMKAGGNSKHAHDVQTEAGHDCNSTNPRPHNQQTSKMHEKKLHADGPVEFIPIDWVSIQWFRH
jgi:hypothetical protein